MPSRLTALDTSFLQVESPTAHMHVGWAAELTPPKGGLPAFAAVRDHIAARLGRAPRYRQRLLHVPFGLHDPIWADDPDFDIDRHVVASRARTLEELAEHALSTPLARTRPLWEIWVATEMSNGQLGILGKAHHCLVDGVAAVELACLMLDPTPDALVARDEWVPTPGPHAAERMFAALGELGQDAAALTLAPVRAAVRPGRLGAAPESVRALGRALGRMLRPAPSSPTLNPSSSSLRSLTTLSRPLGDLDALRRAFGVTVNDIVLAASAGALRQTMIRRGELATRLKTMVPASVRARGAEGDLGNRISMLFVDLPCHEPDPERRLRSVSRAMDACKRSADPAAGEALLSALRVLPRPLHGVVARRVASPRTANLVVSNIPGPPGDLYLLGARLRRAFPVVPLSDEHALSIGVTSLGGELCFGLYTDRLGLPEAALLRDDLERSLDELVALERRRPARQPAARRLQATVPA